MGVQVILDEGADDENVCRRSNGAIRKHLLSGLVEAGHEVGVLALDIVGGQVASISSIVNPDKVTHLGPSVT